MAKKKYSFVVLSNPTAGNEAEYNRWYNEQHLPDVLNVPGFVRAQRFKLSDVQMGGEPDNTHRYLALYEIETDDVAAALKALASRVGTADMIMSDSIDMKGVSARIFEPVTGVVEASVVARASRAA